MCLGNTPCGKLTIRLMNETPGPGGWGEKLLRNRRSFLPGDEPSGDVVMELSRKGWKRGGEGAEWRFWIVA